MTQQDIDNGRLIVVVVGVALLKPAEFVIIKIGVHAGGSSAGAAPPRERIRTRRYALRVCWDGQAIAGVTRVHGLGQLTELVTVHEGGDPSSSRSSPSRMKGWRAIHCRSARHRRLQMIRSRVIARVRELPPAGLGDPAAAPSRRRGAHETFHIRARSLWVSPKGRSSREEPP